MSSRYYDPGIGRWISADTTDILEVQSNLYDKNQYAYCDNNPISRIDEDGDIWQAALAGGGTLTATWAVGGSNVWNPVGWTILGVAAVATVSYVGYKVYKFAKTKQEVDSYARPGQKK